MSLRRSMSAANSSVVHPQPTIPCRDGFRSVTCKTYTYSYKDNEESLFDDDADDLNSRYVEKELALKKINDELERKTSEIFQKIDKFRNNSEMENPVSRNPSYEEMGQGDGLTQILNLAEDRSRRAKTARSAIGIKNKTESSDFGNYFVDSRSTSPLSSAEQSLYKHNNNINASSSTSSSSVVKRPATAGGFVSFPEGRRFHTESSWQRAETAKPGLLDGLEEKHEARLQKATESVLKCVQSKLVNYEQRLTDLQLQYRQKIQENTMLEAKVKALEEDRKRLLKTVQSLQTTTDKFSKSAESSKLNLNIKAQAFASLKKEMDSLKKDVKQKAGMIQSLQTRLDRCMEESRRMKFQHQSTQLNMKQQHNEDQNALADLRQKVLQLEHQKSNIHSTVEKQSQLLKSLRSQKVSLTKIIKKSKLKVDIENEVVSDESESQSQQNETEW